MYKTTDLFNPIRGVAVAFVIAYLYSGLDQIVRLVFESAWYEDEGRNSYDEMQKTEHDCCLKSS